MVYLYCNVPSNGARELVEALGAQRLRKFDGMDFWRKGRRITLSPDDVVVCWGRRLPLMDAARVLNAGADYNKRDEIMMLAEAEVPAPGYKAHLMFQSSKLPIKVWLGRSANHVGGADLLNPPKQADYFTEMMEFVREYRIHSFNGRSIRAGQKIVREGFKIAPSVDKFVLGQNAHPWIRSFDAGWRIDYNDFESTSNLRKIAHKAVKALGLTFGAVDVGETSNGKLYVLEVNKAPGLEGNSITAYARAIKSWVKSDAEDDDEKPVVPEEADPAPVPGQQAGPRIQFEPVVPVGRWDANVPQDPERIQGFFAAQQRAINAPNPVIVPIRDRVLVRPMDVRAREIRDIEAERDQRIADEVFRADRAWERRDAPQGVIDEVAPVDLHDPWVNIAPRRGAMHVAEAQERFWRVEAGRPQVGPQPQPVARRPEFNIEEFLEEQRRIFAEEERREIANLPRGE